MKGGGSSELNRVEGGEVKFDQINIKKWYNSTLSEKRYAETARPIGERIAPARAPQTGLQRGLRAHARPQPVSPLKNQTRMH